MLTTCSIADGHWQDLTFYAQVKPDHRDSPLRKAVICEAWLAPAAVEKVMADRPTVGEEIKDLVVRHFLETDDACLRVWLQAIHPPSSSSYNTLPTASRPEQTHAASAQRRRTREGKQAAGNGKKWYREDSERLAAISGRLRETVLPSLYDGGPFLPSLRLPLISSKAARAQYLESSTDHIRKFVLYHKSFWDSLMDTIYPWPEGDASRRVLYLPSCSWRNKKQWVHAITTSPRVDFPSLTTGRRLERNEVWSTALCADDVSERGRSAHRSRRRGTSEPPHGVFTSARVPLPSGRLDGFLIFPQMKLQNMYQRSRRRSLSRTRIAEMFDWNARPTHRNHHRGRHDDTQCDTQHNAQQGPTASDYSGRLVSLCQSFDESIRLRETKVEEVDWKELSRMLHKVLAEDAIRKNPCSNCTMPHSVCPNPCGFCGAPSTNSTYIVRALSLAQTQIFKSTPRVQGFKQPENLHVANECPVAKQNRCKCVPFPQYHVAAKCGILCSRDCGNRYPPGHFRHKNAMTCTSRCCMCGIKGHSGSQCKLKRCRCGGSHLGQDCTWKVDCRVEGCYNFLCGLHCSECGMSREQLEEGLRFQGRQCPSCVGRASLATDMTANRKGTEGVTDRAEAVASNHLPRKEARQRGRRNPRKSRRTKSNARPEQKEEPPWYAPLQPLTRPIVVSKSGKRITWRGPAKK
jgi:hypothetical protein